MILARIHKQDNMIDMPNPLSGNDIMIHSTINVLGSIDGVWM
jgi:hypothetical protein